MSLHMTVRRKPKKGHIRILIVSLVYLFCKNTSLSTTIDENIMPFKYRHKYVNDIYVFGQFRIVHLVVVAPSSRLFASYVSSKFMRDGTSHDEMNPSSPTIFRIGALLLGQSTHHQPTPTPTPAVGHSHTTYARA